MKYIDAEKLRAEIERLKSILTDPLCSQGNILGPDWVAGGNKMLNEISSFITTLQQEQPEVDLEREIRDYFSKWGYNIYNGAITMDNGIVVTLSSIQNVARHFWNKGYNARKEE